MKRLITALIFIMTFSIVVYAGDFKVPAEKYRNWHHVKSMVIFDEKHPLYNPFNGIHHVYVNKKGLETIKKQTDRKFPDGTTIAIVFYEHKLADGAYVEGSKRIEAFMVKDSKKYKATDGWGYYGYDGSGKNLVKDMANDCHSCHAQVKNKDFVFSNWIE
jgi:hypothetical protein